MIDTYKDALINLKNNIPEDYIYRNKLINIIEFSCNDIDYKAPEIISQSFTNYCKFLIPYLPKQKDDWIVNSWEKIHDVSKKNNVRLKNFYR